MSSDRPKRPYYPPKDGTKAGRPRAHYQAAKELAWAIQAKIPMDVIVRFKLAIAEGHSPFFYTRDGQLDVKWDDRGGILPTLAERIAAVDWMVDRSAGRPTEMTELAAFLEHSATTQTDQHDALLANADPARIAQAREALRLLLAPGVSGVTVRRRRPGEGDSTSDADAEDAELVDDTEQGTEPGSGTGGPTPTSNGE